MSALKVSVMKRRKRSRAGVSSLSLVWLLACVSAGLWVLLGGRVPTEDGAPAPVPAQLAGLGGPNESAERGPHFQPIDRLCVGQRVVTPGTDPGVSLPTAADVATWRLLTLELVSTWPDGTRDAMHVRTLQPPAWLAAHHVQVGARVPIPLDLREMGVPTNQPAEVVAVDPCPAIEDGPGRVVLTTVNHLNSFLFDLKVNGARAPPQDLEVTGWHKLYSEDRQAWTSVCELHVGEVLRGRDGPLTVESLRRHPGVERVYNLTVEDEHQYYVSAADLLAHNTGCTPTPRGDTYSVAFEMQLDRSVWGRSDSVHFNRANAALDAAIQSDPVFAAQMDALIPGVRGSVSRVGGRATPGGWVWHHSPEPGIMQLVPVDQHTPGSIFWKTLHPNGEGGYAIWARPAGAPPR